MVVTEPQLKESHPTTTTPSTNTYGWLRTHFPSQFGQPVTALSGSIAPMANSGHIIKETGLMGLLVYPWRIPAILRRGRLREP